MLPLIDFHKFTLTTAYDVSTCDVAGVETFNFSVQPRAISFSSSGTTFFIYDGTSTDAIRQYSLSSPFDLNGCSFTKKLS